MSSDSEDEFCFLTSNAAKYMSDGFESFMKKTIDIPISPEPLKRRMRARKVISDSVSVDTIEDDDDVIIEEPAQIDLNTKLAALSDKYSNPLQRKRLKRKCKESPQEPTIINKIINIQSSDEEEETQPEINPIVDVKLLWKSIHKKVIKVRKFENLTTVYNFIIDTYKVDPTLLLFTINDKEIDIKQHTYASLRLTETTIIEAGVLSHAPQAMESIDTIQEGAMMFKIQYAGNKKFPAYLKADDKMDMLYGQVIKQLHLTIDTCKIYFDGSIVKHTDTIESLGAEENDIFDVLQC